MDVFVCFVSSVSPPKATRVCPRTYDNASQCAYPALGRAVRISQGATVWPQLTLCLAHRLCTIDGVGRVGTAVVCDGCYFRILWHYCVFRFRSLGEKETNLYFLMVLLVNIMVCVTLYRCERIRAPALRALRLRRALVNKRGAAESV